MLSVVEKEKVCFTCKHFFGVELTPMQAEIVGSIVLAKSKRIVISCMTRYGKTFVVAMALLLYALFYERKKIILVAPTDAQAHILRNYVADFIVGNDRFRRFVDLEASGIDRIKREVSRKRITFSNGSVLQVLSAEGTGNRLMGFGADLLIVDESCLINPDVYRTKIMRMLGDSEDSVLVDIGNPWNRDSVMFSHWVSDDFLKVHVNYKVGLVEGRIDENFLSEQRSILSDNEFKVLYEAEFPMSGEDALIRWDWIQRSFVDGPVPDGDVFFGVDVAEAGNDLSVCTQVVKCDGVYWVKAIDFWRKVDTMDTAKMVEELVSVDGYNKVFVDAIGVGKGVADSLVERGVKVVPVKVGMAPVRERERFLNQKAEFYWKLRTLFEDGSIRLLGCKNRERLVNELLMMKYELTSNGKIRIVDPEQKSPDFADSLMLGCSDGTGFLFGFA
jgi:hypothetical protein